jgi:hypothetical protein
MQPQIVGSLLFGVAVNSEEKQLERPRHITNGEDSMERITSYLPESDVWKRFPS